MQISKKTRIILGWTLAVIILVYLGRLIYANRTQLAAWQWDFNWGYLAFSFLLVIAAFIFMALAWRSIIYGFGYKVGLVDSFRILYLSQLGRYIPGKIWQVAGMITLAGEAGIPPRVSTASFVINQAYFIPAAFLLAPIFIGNLKTMKSLYLTGNIVFLAFTLIFMAFLVLFFKPDYMNRVLNWILKKLKREPVDYNPKFINRLDVFFYYIVAWLLLGFSYHYFLQALPTETTLPMPYAIGTYITAYVLGYLAFLSPGGLGFREGIMTALLSPFFGPPLAASIALIHRIWITLIEGFISLLALLTYRFKKR